MAIEKIRSEDFPRSERGGLSEESVAVMALQSGEAVKFPCRWKHNGRICTGTNNAYQAAHRSGFHVSTRCRDKMIYVMRRIGKNN